MVKIRLTRMGRHKSPFYRIVAMDSRAKANGAYIQLLGTYNPIKGEIKLENDLIMNQLKQGAQPTETVRSMLKKEGLWSKFMAEKQANESRKANQKKNNSKPKTEKKAAPKKVEPKPVVQPKPAVEPKPTEIKKKPTVELNIKKDSKLVSKISNEEIEKRATQTFEVDNSVNDNDTSEKTIMISLDKDLIEKIVNDEKEIIFFKRLPVQKVKRVLIYSTKPIGKVIGEFDLHGTQVLSKTKAWTNYGSKSILTKKQFDEYFKDQENTKLMEVAGLILYPKTRELKEFKLSKGPSGFCYLK